MLLFFAERSQNYLDAFEKVNKYFVKTQLTDECCSKLKEKGLVILIGKPGCGKTSTAIHLMSKTEYTSWTKLKITEEELVQIKPDDKTIIYIDDLFDGFLYERNLFNWWNSLFNFYSSWIEKEKKVLLIITAKHTAMEKACVCMEAKKQNQAESFFVRANLHVRTLDEKLELLKSQFNLATELKRVERTFFENHLRDQIPDERGSIGFPLCAFLYSFEDRTAERNSSILVQPRSYVRKYIEFEIQNDTEQTVKTKTLFLLLLFYFLLGATPSLPSYYLEYNVRHRFVEFLKKACPEVNLDEFEPLSFAYLNKKVLSFQQQILIKINEMYEFRHQIYLYGIADYFFQKHFDLVVDHFPFAILRTCELYDIPAGDIDKLLDRLKKEIKKKHFFWVLSCNIFQNPSIEKKFCDLHSKEPFLENLLNTLDETTGFKFPIIFWASKYSLKKLVNVLLSLANTNESIANLQFYIAMLGECCAVDENYIKCTENSLEISEVRKSVFNFKTTDGRTILHLLLSSDKSDADAYRCLTKLLEDPEKRKLDLDHSLLDTALRQLKYSRLKCLRELIMRQKVIGKLDSQCIATLVKTSEESKCKNIELECLCRIGILVIYGVKVFSKETKPESAFFKDSNTDFQWCTLKEKLKNKMAKRIENCLEKFSYRLPSKENKSVSFLNDCYETAINILSEMENPLDVNDVNNA